MPASPAAIFQPNAVAIVGASEAEGWANWSKVIFENLCATGATLPVYPVNPRYSEVWQRQCYRALNALPAQADLALVIVPARFVPQVLREALESGFKAAIVYASGFGEGADGQGKELACELEELAAAGLRITGPNCMGAISVHERLLFYPSNPVTRVRTLPAGDTGVIFQSGGTFQFWLYQAALRGLGFSYGVTSGSELDLDLASYIDFMVEDERTNIICCLIEGIRRPAAFAAAARKALVAGKPLLAVKIGRSSRGRAAAQSHTGLLAGDDAVFDAVCERYGIVRCASLDDMIDTALVMRGGRIARGSRVAMISYSGGARGLFLDEADVAGLEFATLSAETLATVGSLVDPGQAADNPLDAGAVIPYDQARFAAVCKAMTNDPAVDVVALQGQLPSLPDDRQKPDSFAEIAAATTKPVFAYSRTAQSMTDDARTFQTRAGIAFVQGIPQAARTLGSLIKYGRRRLAPPLLHRDVAEVTEAATEVAADLARLGAPPPRSRYADTPDEAAQAALEVGFPVALKGIAEEVVHKTEFGAVRLDLNDPAEVRTAASDLAMRFAARGITRARFLVQEMVRGLEAVVGAREDPEFGPIIVLGIGGVLVELLDDVAVRLLPVQAEDVRLMIAGLRGKKLFRSFRGGAAPDVDALIAATVGVGQFYLERRRWIEDFELNPLTVLPQGQGVRAVDVRLIKRSS